MHAGMMIKIVARVYMILVHMLSQVSRASTVSFAFSTEGLDAGMRHPIVVNQGFFVVKAFPGALLADEMVEIIMLDFPCRTGECFVAHRTYPRESTVNSLRLSRLRSEDQIERSLQFVMIFIHVHEELVLVALGAARYDVSTSCRTGAWVMSKSRGSVECVVAAQAVRSRRYYANRFCRRYINEDCLRYVGNEDSLRHVGDLNLLLTGKGTPNLILV